MSTIREEFNVHLLNDEGIAAARAVAEIFSDALDRLEALGLAGSERALAVMALQQAAFWAKRAVCTLPQYQKGQEAAFTGQNAR